MSKARNPSWRATCILLYLASLTETARGAACHRVQYRGRLSYGRRLRARRRGLLPL